MGKQVHEKNISIIRDELDLKVIDSWNVLCYLWAKLGMAYFGLFFFSEMYLAASWLGLGYGITETTFFQELLANSKIWQ